MWQLESQNAKLQKNSHHTVCIKSCFAIILRFLSRKLISILLIRIVQTVILVFLNIICFPITILASIIPANRLPQLLNLIGTEFTAFPLNRPHH